MLRTPICLAYVKYFMVSAIFFFFPNLEKARNLKPENQGSTPSFITYS